MKYLFAILLFSLIVKAEPNYKDVTLGRLFAVKRSFKIDVDACRDKWDVDSDDEKASCSMAAKGKDDPNYESPILDNGDMQFECDELLASDKATKSPASVDKENKNYLGGLRILTHGNFGYIVKVNTAVKFSAVKECLLAALKKVPEQSVSTTFVIVKPD